MTRTKAETRAITQESNSKELLSRVGTFFREKSQNVVEKTCYWNDISLHVLSQGLYPHVVVFSNDNLVCVAFKRNKDVPDPEQKPHISGALIERF